jgi:hypothetical protein
MVIMVVMVVGKETGARLLKGVATAAEDCKENGVVVITGLWGIKQGSRIQCRRESRRSLILARKPNLLQWKLLLI